MDNFEKHSLYMRRCIELGKLAKERGDSPVGAVVVKGDKIIAEGMEGGKTHQDITYHAEIEAIRNLVKKTAITDLSEYTMYTTHEPCIMCSYVLRHYKVGTIVWGLSTGEIGGYSSTYKLLQDTTIRVWGSTPRLISGVLEEDCRALHR